MSVLVFDNETKKHVVLSPGETSAKQSPTFSGACHTHDPLRFLEEFEDAASWNNWKSDERKKELFIRCLTGYAKEWVNNIINNDRKAYDSLKYSDGTENCLVIKFRKNFVTEEWYERYQGMYEARVQLPHETPLEYLHMKRALLRRADPDNKERSIKQAAREIIKGLLPKFRNFCNYKIKDPYNKEVQREVYTFEGLEKLFAFAGDILCDEVKAPTLGQKEVAVNAMVKAKSVQQNKGDTRENTEPLTRFEKMVLNRLDKLDKIENDLAAMNDRVSSLEKGQQGSFGDASKCFNCYSDGHFARECNQSCWGCRTSSHTGAECPKRNGQRRARINVIGEEDQDFQVGSPSA
jgi:hypothetical protein